MNIPNELSVDIIENAIVTPVKSAHLFKDNYPKWVNCIGSIYFPSGKPHEKSLLFRDHGLVQVQAPEISYQPDIKDATVHVKKGIYGGIINPHYGHFLLETLSRSWYLITNSVDDIYFHGNNNLQGWQQELFEAMSIKNRIYFITEVTKFDQLIVPEPGVVLKTYFNKAQAEALTLIGQKIIGSADLYSSKKFWISRSSLDTGRIAGESEFEQELQKEGFKVVHPEKLPLREQIQIFEGKNVIAGFTSSALHTMVFAQNQGAKILHFSRLANINPNYEICVKAKQFQAEYYSFFIKPGKLSIANKNVLQDLSKVWQVLYQHGLVKKETYYDPDLELKLQKLDEETQKSYPNLIERKTTMNENINNQSGQQISPKIINHSVRRINKLAKGLNANSYLEIGVAHGQTFFDISIAEKTAVDPKFSFNMSAINQNDNIFFREETSDDFFSTLAHKVRYDIIFIDGLHTFEQTYRDLCNSLLHTKDHTVLLIDDTKPIDVYSAIPNYAKAVKFRKHSGVPGLQWHGDVFKVIFALHDFHLGLNYRTIVGSGNPQTLVWCSNNGWRKPLFNSLETISRLSYFDFVEHIDIMRECSEEEAINLCLDELAKI